MKKSILNLSGALELSKNEQKSINGGLPAGCKLQTWSGTSLTNCKTTRPGGFYYTYDSSTHQCSASFCPA